MRAATPRPMKTVATQASAGRHIAASDSDTQSE
jgi:hypothetical protein